MLLYVTSKEKILNFLDSLQLIAVNRCIWIIARDITRDEDRKIIKLNYKFWKLCRAGCASQNSILICVNVIKQQKSTLKHFPKKSCGSKLSNACNLQIRICLSLSEQRHFNPCRAVLCFSALRPIHSVLLKILFVFQTKGTTLPEYNWLLQGWHYNRESHKFQAWAVEYWYKIRDRSLERS